jgi:hypothetical protein
MLISRSAIGASLQRRMTRMLGYRKLALPECPRAISRPTTVAYRLGNGHTKTHGGGLEMRVRLISGVKRVTVLGPSSASHVTVRSGSTYGSSEKLKFSVIKPTGEVERGELRLDLGPIKRGTKRMRPIERKIRKLVRAEYKALGRYLVLHDRSRRKRRNGWAADLGSNVIKVIRHRN